MSSRCQNPLLFSERKIPDFPIFSKQGRLENLWTMSQGYAHSTDLGEDVSNVVKRFPQQTSSCWEFLSPNWWWTKNSTWIDKQPKSPAHIQILWKIAWKTGCRRDTLLLFDQDVVLMGSTGPPKENGIWSQESGQRTIFLLVRWS